MSAKLRVKKWDDFQHYKDRTPPWIKLYNKLLEDYEFASLPDASKAHLVGIWLLASRTENELPADAEYLARKINATSPIDLDALVSSGFLETYGDASGTLADCKQNAIPEREREAETEQSRERERDAQSVDEPDEFSTPTLAGYLGEYVGCLHGMSEMTQKAIMGLVGPKGTEEHRWARLEDERRPPLLASVIQSYQAAREGQSWHRGFFLSMVDSAVRDARKPPPTSEAAQHTTDSERAKIAAQRAAARKFDEEQRRKMQDGAPSVTSISDIMGKLKPGDAA